MIVILLLLTILILVLTLLLLQLLLNSSRRGRQCLMMKIPNIFARCTVTPNMERMGELHSRHCVVQHNDCFSLSRFPFGVQVVCAHTKSSQYLAVRHVGLAESVL